jgi:hypothetical protein
MCFMVDKKSTFHREYDNLALLLVDDSVIIFDCIVGWLLKWTQSVQKATLVPLDVLIFVVDY